MTVSASDGNGLNRGPGAASPGSGAADAGSAEPRAECVRCGAPTEYPASYKGATLCPVCEWQGAQRLQCSG